MASARLPAKGVSVWLAKGSTAQVAALSSAGGLPRSTVEQAASRASNAVQARVFSRGKGRDVWRMVMYLEGGSVMVAVDQLNFAGQAG